MRNCKIQLDYDATKPWLVEFYDVLFSHKNRYSTFLEAEQAIKEWLA